MRKLLLPALILALAACTATAGMEKAVEYNEKGVAALRQGNFYAAIDYLRKALAEAPDNAIIASNLSNAYNNYGLKLMKDGKTLGAIDNFKRAIRYNPANAYAYLDLGQAYYNNNDLVKAVENLEEAYRLDPGISALKEFLDKARSETRVETGLNTTDSMHFTIVWSEGLRVDNLAALRTSLEGAYTRVGSFFNRFPQEKTTVVVYSDALYASQMSGKPYWAHAMFDGKIRIPMGGQRFPGDYIRRLIYHEYTHALMRHIAGTSCPLWLNEGLAAYMEDNPLFRNRDFFKAFISGEGITSLADMPVSYGQIGKPQKAYREFYLMAGFLISRLGNSGIRKMVDSFGRGLSVDDVIKESLSMDPQAFDRAWKAHVRRRLGL